jgi:hypothetical protein
VIVDLAVPAYFAQIDEIASDIGRLRRKLVGDEYGTHLLGRVAGRVEVLDLLVAPSAAQIYRANLFECGDKDESVVAALEDVDGRARHLRGLLGEKRT